MDYFRVGRIANLILGGWLLVSSMLLTGTSSGRAINAALIGIASMVFALGALTRLPVLRFGTAALAIWLFLSSWLVPGGTALTVANDLVVATLMFGFAVIPPEPDAVPAHMGLRPERTQPWQRAEEPPSVGS